MRYVAVTITSYAYFPKFFCEDKYGSKPKLPATSVFEVDEAAEVEEVTAILNSIDPNNFTITTRIDHPAIKNYLHFLFLAERHEEHQNDSQTEEFDEKEEQWVRREKHKPEFKSIHELLKFRRLENEQFDKAVRRETPAKIKKAVVVDGPIDKLLNRLQVKDEDMPTTRFVRLYRTRVLQIVLKKYAAAWSKAHDVTFEAFDIDGWPEIWYPIELLHAICLHLDTES